MDRFADFKAQFSRVTRLIGARFRGRDEAEDAVQEAYTRLLTYIAAGNEVVQPEGFLVRVAHNVALDGRRRVGVRRNAPRPVEQLNILDASPGPEEWAEAEELVLQTQVLLDQAVGERARRAFFLQALEGFTYEEIAQRMSLSLRTVERDLAKALQALTEEDILKQLRDLR